VRRKDLGAFRKRNVLDALAPVFETVKKTRSSLEPEKALIGFAGAPWTVATYMLAGGPNKDPASLRSYFYGDEGFIRELVALLADATADYLIAQIDAGADAVQLFDTWAGGLPEYLTRVLSVEPMRQIAAAVKTARPKTPVILFPKGVGALLPEYAMLEECDAIGIDSAVPRDFVRKTISDYTAVQGGLDPLLVVEGGEPMKAAARKLLRCFAGTPYIFNLGHGLVPQTPPENVGALVDFVRSGEWAAPDA
jgi:uroporphyrinogen decarboxylase